MPTGTGVRNGQMSDRGNKKNELTCTIQEAPLSKAELVARASREVYGVCCKNKRRLARLLRRFELERPDKRFLSETTALPHPIGGGSSYPPQYLVLRRFFVSFCATRQRVSRVDRVGEMSRTLSEVCCQNEPANHTTLPQFDAPIWVMVV